MPTPRRDDLPDPAGGDPGAGGRKIKIVNIGLEPWEAVAMGLEVETVEASKSRKPVADYVALYDGDNGDWDLESPQDGPEIAP